MNQRKPEVESARAVSRLSTGGGGNLVKAEWLAGLALLAALPGVKAQPLELRFAVYDLFIWVVGVVITGVALLRAWLWLFGAITLFQFGSGLDLHQVQEESESTTEVSVGSVTYPNCAQEVHGGQGVSGLDRTSGGSSEDSNKSDSDVFDEEEWKRSQRALIDREPVYWPYLCSESETEATAGQRGHRRCTQHDATLWARAILVHRCRS